MNSGTLTGPGNLVKGRWKILKKIGQGAFGEVYSARNVVTSELVAIKVERVDSNKQVLKLEVAVLRKLYAANCDYAVSFISCGRHNEYNYMVMELLGDNISELRRSQPNGKFSMFTTLKLGIQMLRAIQAVHDHGYLHRDVKPSNFAMGLSPNKRHNCYLIDFGLARRYLLPNNEVRPPRGQTGFRGTARYASINSHQSKDLSRRDDLWSLLYVLIEFAKGKLPWRRIKDKDEVGDMKMKLNNPQLVSELPQEFLCFMQHLQTLRYSDRPNYTFLNELLSELYHKIGGDENTPFDWEREHINNHYGGGRTKPRIISSLVDLCFFKVVKHIDLYKEINLETELQQRLFKFILRVNNGEWNENIMLKLLNTKMNEIDVENCEIEQNNWIDIFNKCTKLKTLKLGIIKDNGLIKQMINSNNFTLRKISFSGDGKSIPSKFLRDLSNYYPNLIDITIKNALNLSDSNLLNILKHCSNLECLRIPGCKKIKGNAFKLFTSKKKILKIKIFDLSYCDLSKSGFKYLTKVCTDVEELTFAPLVASFKITSNDISLLLQNCKRLNSLELAIYQFDMDSILAEIAKECTQLNKLLLDGLSMTDYGLQNVVLHCTQLKTLRFRYGDGVTDTSLTQIARNCTLDSLTLDFWNKFNRLSVSDHGIKTLLQSCGNLKELSLCSCLILTGACFPETVYFPNLQLLNLSDCIQLNDFAIRRITESCPNLLKLSLNNLNNLSCTSLEAISSGCPQLEELNLQQCTCFFDDVMIELLQGMPQLFLQVTRFGNPTLKGIQIEVHKTNVKELFDEYPNTYRDRAFDRTRRRMYGMGP